MTFEQRQHAVEIVRRNMRTAREIPEDLAQRRAYSMFAAGAIREAFIELLRDEPGFDELEFRAQTGR